MPDNLIKMLTKEMKLFVQQKISNKLLVGNLCLLDVTHTHTHTCTCTYRHVFTQHIQELTHIQTLLGVKQKNIVIEK